MKGCLSRGWGLTPNPPNEVQKQLLGSIISDGRILPCFMTVEAYFLNPRRGPERYDVIVVVVCVVVTVFEKMPKALLISNI